jgi:hypothetical protein
VPTRCLSAFAFIVLIPLTASAGPWARPYWNVPWSYSIRVIYPEDYGDAFRVDLPNGPTGSSNAHDGYYTVFSPEYGKLPRAGDPAQRYSFKAEITVTDTDSGQSGVFTLPAVGVAEWIDYGGNNGWTSTGIAYPGQDPWTWEEERTLKLGENTYYVEGVGRAFYLHAAAPDHPQVPEPGTMALACLGLAAVGGWWAKRRGGRPRLR